MTDAPEVAEPIDYGYKCETCGLSDWGFDRLMSNGFTPHPCFRCKPHFQER